MSCQIDSREVLAYLNELGYQNITAQQLKEFIRDLKKLIKYDRRLHQKLHEQERIETVEPHRHFHESDVFSNLYETSTVASKAKEVPKKEKVISVQIKKPVSSHSRQTCSSSESKPMEESVRSNSTIEGSQKSMTRSLEVSTGTHEGSTCSQMEGSNVSKIKTKAKSWADARKMQNKENQLRPRASFIRPRTVVKTCKSDPVALYHQYQAEWKRQKFPGEDHHSNLRWIIRERMLGQPQMLSTAPAVDVLPRKRCKSGRV